MRPGLQSKKYQRYGIIVLRYTPIFHTVLEPLERVTLYFTVTKKLYSFFFWGGAVQLAMPLRIHAANENGTQG